MSSITRRAPGILAGLAQELGVRVDPLAIASGETTVLVGTRESLLLRRDDKWTSWPWERIANGSWDSQRQRFRWRTLSGQQHEVSLDEPGRLPELFRERVQASILTTVVLETSPGQVQIVGRRGLGEERQVHWYAIAAGGADLTDPATRAAVIAETDRLTSDYT